MTGQVVCDYPSISSTVALGEKSLACFGPHAKNIAEARCHESRLLLATNPE
jgi:hypothetical protein